jgi:peptidase A4-like protein
MRFARLAIGLLLIGLGATSAALGSAGTRAVLEHAPPARLIGHSNSLNWSGYASFGSTFTDVKGSWTQPAAKCNGKSTYASFWVGLDGYDSSTVEQLGTEADCSHGKAVYYAWWEMFPNVSHTIGSFTVTPGASYTAEVQSAGGDDFSLTLSGGGNNPSPSRRSWGSTRLSARQNGSPRRRHCARRAAASSPSRTSAP